MARIAEAIRAKVRMGRVSPGQRLVEGELTDEFGVSRGPVREALRRLEAEGLVEITQHRGASVRRMTRSDVLELFTVRKMLEGGAARLAAVNVDSADNRPRMEAALAQAEDWTMAPDVIGYTDVNVAFHALILAMADNGLLSKMVAQLQVPTYRILFPELVTVSGIRQSSADHVMIASAILAGDPDAAEFAIHSHIQRTCDLTLDVRTGSLF